MKKIPGSLFVLATAAGLVFQAGAATRTWLGANTAWSDTSNWSDSAVPTNGDAVVIPVTATGPTMAAGVYPVAGTYLSFEVQSGAAVTCLGDSTAVNPDSGGTALKPHGTGVTIRCQSALIDGVLSADAQGFSANQYGYPGPGFLGLSGSHGGRSGYNSAGKIYGKVSQPTALGSGGYWISSGGGAIALDVAGTLVLNGRVTAIGQSAGGTDSGAGGSVWLVCDTFSGSGVVNAASGHSTSTDVRRQSGGGRVAIECNSWTYGGAIGVAGGDDRNGSQPGSLWAPALYTGATETVVITNHYHYHFPETTSDRTWSLAVTNGGAAFFSGFTNATLTVTNFCVANGSVLRFDVDDDGASGSAGLNRLLFTHAGAVLSGSMAVISEGTSLVSSVTVSNSTLNFGAAAVVSNLQTIVIGTNSTVYLPEGDYALTGDLDVPLTSTLYCRGRRTVVNEASGGTALKPHGAGPRFACQNATIDGQLTADDLGFPGAYYGYRGPGQGHWSGGHGGMSGTDPKTTDRYGSLKAPTALGSGGYHRGGGAGAIKLAATGVLSVGGAISANGGTDGGSSAGSGGSLWLVCDSLTGAGAISARGGSSFRTDVNACGGGGRVAIDCNSSTFSGAIQVGGGSNRVAKTQPGTIWFPQWFEGRQGTPDSPEPLVLSLPDEGFRYWFADAITTNYWDLSMSNSWVEFYEGSVVISNLAMAKSTFRPTDESSMSNLSVNGSMTLTNSVAYLPPYGVYDMTGDLTLHTDSTIYVVGDLTAVNEDSGGTTNAPHGAGLSINCRDALVLGRLDALGMGFLGKLEVGIKGPGTYGAVLGGGGYGGQGGGWFNMGRRAYGSLTRPTALGSGGYYNSHGGGAVKLWASGTLTLDGTIDARGTGVTEGGSGGSVWLMAGDFAGNGSIIAKGKDATNGANKYGGGGGGRVAIEYGTWSFVGSCTVDGGETLYTGEPEGRTGTVFLCHSPWLGTTSTGVNGIRLDTQLSVSSNDVRVVRTNLTWKSSVSWVDVSTDVTGSTVTPNLATYTLSGVGPNRECMVSDNGVPMGGVTNASESGVLTFSATLDGPHLLRVDFAPVGTVFMIR